MVSSMQLGKYTLKRKLAVGGMAEIWLSEQRGPGGFAKELVIKRILPHLASDQKFVQMFLDEARLAAQLSHPNIVQIYDLGEIDGSYFIAMEYVRGQDLDAIMELCWSRGHAVDPVMAARIVSDACSALDYAHNLRDSNGIPLRLVHRDISPQNILVSEDGVVKLVDFGVAKAATSVHKTQTGAVKGKFCYMSPEQIGGRELDGRSDLFAMGIVLYQLVTGRRPFGHESELAAITAIVHQAPSPPREIIRDLPVNLERIILTALEKDRENRYPSADAMQTDLEAFLDESGVSIRAKELAAYLAEVREAPPFAPVPTSQEGVAFAETLLEVTPEPIAPMVPGGTAREGPVAPLPTPVPRAASGSASSPAAKLPERSTPPGSAARPPPSARVFISPAAADQTLPIPVPETEDREKPTLPSKPAANGIGWGLIGLLVLILLALGGSSFYLVTLLTAKPDQPDTPATGSDAGIEDVALAVGPDVATAPGPGDISQAVAEPGPDDAAEVLAEEAGPPVIVTTPDLGPKPPYPPVVADAGPGEITTPPETFPDMAAPELVPIPPTAPDAGPQEDLPSDVAAPDAGPVVDQPIPPAEDLGVSQEEQPVAAEDAPSAEAEQAVPPDDATTAAPDAETVAVDTGRERERRDRGHTTPPVDESEPGVISISVSPPGRYDFFIDGEHVGRGSSLRHRTAPGSHTVEVRPLGESTSREETVQVEPGATRRVRIDFRD